MNFFIAPDEMFCDEVPAPLEVAALACGAEGADEGRAAGHFG